MVTPGFSADSACVLSVRHADYARSAVIAYWRMMPTRKRREVLWSWLGLGGAGEERRRDPLQTIEWGATEFSHPPGRFLGVQDLVDKFDDDRVDGKGRRLGWAMALMEMLVGPMLLTWVPA